MDCSFFFGIGLELILECLISIIHLIECGGNEALSDFISDINCDQFYTTLVAKFDQKTRFLLVHNIRDQANNCHYYEEIIQLSLLIQLQAEYVPSQKIIVDKGLIETLYQAILNMMVVEQNLSRDTAMMNSISILAILVSKTET